MSTRFVYSNTYKLFIKFLWWISTHTNSCFSKDELWSLLLHKYSPEEDLSMIALWDNYRRNTKALNSINDIRSYSKSLFFSLFDRESCPLCKKYMLQGKWYYGNKIK